MHRIQYHRYGGPETMRLEEFELPSPKAGEIAITVKTASVNPIDWKLRQGQLKIVTGRSFPRAMGADVTGVVHAVGPGVTQFKPGDEVFGLARLKESGAFAEGVITRESYVALKPAELSFEQASALTTGAVMAWNGLVQRARLRRGQRVFVNGCTGGVGEAVVQIARMLGADVAGSCSAASASRADELGVTTVYDYATTDFSELRGVFDVVYDTSGALPVKTAMGMLNATGVFLDINATAAKFLHSVFNRRHKIFFCSATTQILTEVARAAVDGSLRVQIGEIVTLDSAIGLITDLEKGRKIGGKAIIRLDGTR
ncbi:NAD(P)-dependent alcohol dehydrogenase [Kutzneria buriramensis]|uniref:NADPH:quinone reductase-like Zn-dependent oxidoreductase n=1 Tax=Kutzneria buriramensis TaxID=1045776 RepID=A0A3E0G7F9_9PSEU|nr:NAD(P)-dependent alcohol dehydrogenase [Kutzneria buriramensis]REH17889.1 NADPH:quinone reductase-like Zn-dependent oxidoreductase [Kutzneria buriramensis]